MNTLYVPPNYAKASLMQGISSSLANHFPPSLLHSLPLLQSVTHAAPWFASAQLLFDLFVLANTLIRLLDRPKDKQIETQLAQIYVSVFSNLTYNGILGKIIITSNQSSLYYLLDVMHSGAQLGYFERRAKVYL